MEGYDASRRKDIAVDRDRRGRVLRIAATVTMSQMVYDGRYGTKREALDDLLARMATTARAAVRRIGRGDLANE